MKKLSVFTVAAFACLCLIGVMSSEVFADGTEALGVPSISIESGSGVVAAGVGMIEMDLELGGDISVYVPHGAEIQQVLLYWEGRGYLSTPDKKVMVRKRLPEEESNWKNVEDEVMIGESFSSNGLSPYWSSAYRADVTNLNLVVPGHSRFSVKGLDFTHNDGAGVIVIFKDGSGDADVQLVDGNDFAFLEWDDQRTVPQTFDFAPSPIDRTATLSMLFSSVAGTVSTGNFRTSSIHVTVGGFLTTYDNLLNSWGGEEFDFLNIDVVIPADASSLEVEAVSCGLTAASFNWIVAALSVPEKPEECGPCDGKITKLTLQYNGTDTADIEVFQKKPYESIFSNEVKSGKTFHFEGTDKKGTMGTEIRIYVTVDGEESETKLHTSCSQDIYIGLKFGDEEMFQIISGESRNGGPLCPEQ